MPFWSPGLPALSVAGRRLEGAILSLGRQVLLGVLLHLSAASPNLGSRLAFNEAHANGNARACESYSWLATLCFLSQYAGVLFVSYRLGCEGE
ncbi:MAG: hypothetical protein OXU20_09680 [Myxococcales bacterium]|nr:hypothetical protein [Myxococcales bacterium]